MPLLQIGSRDNNEQNGHRYDVLALPRMRAGLESGAARQPPSATALVARVGKVDLTALPSPIPRRTTAASAFGQLGLAIALVLALPVVLIAVGAPVVLLVRVLIELAERF